MKIMGSKYFLLFLFFNLCANAQWSKNAHEHLMIDSGGEEPKMCSDGDGGAYVIWSDFSYERTRIYLQHVNKYGVKSLATPMIVCDTSDLQRDREIIEDGYGGALVMVSARKVVGQIGGFKITNAKLFVQRIDKNMNKLWGENGVRVSMQENNQDCYAFPKIVSDKKHNAYVFFGDRRDDEVFNLYMQRIRYDGQRMWSDSGYRIATSVVTPKWLLISNISGKIIIWYAQYGGSGPWRVLKSYDSLGSQNWVRMSSDSYLHLSKTQSDKMFITRQKKYIDGYRALFQANLFDINGDSLWSNWITVTDSSNYYFPSSNVKTLYDTILVANIPKLEIFPSTVSHYTQAITASGKLLFPHNFRYTSKNVSAYTHADFTQGVDGEFIALYSFPTDSSYNTYAQKVNLQGDLLWDSLGVLLSNMQIPEIGGVYFYYITSAFPGGAIALGSNEPHFGIYLQQISRNGGLGEVLTSVSRNEIDISRVSNFELSEPYPNPFNPQSTVTITNNKYQFLTLKVFDLIGREIHKESFNLSPGSFHYRLNIDRLNIISSSGFYIVSVSNGDGKTVSKKLLFLK